MNHELKADAGIEIKIFASASVMTSEEIFTAISISSSFFFAGANIFAFNNLYFGVKTKYATLKYSLCRISQDVTNNLFLC